MSTENRNRENSGNESDNSRNNNGTIGGEGGVKNEPKGSFHEFTERVKDPEPVNERGIRENEENHSTRDIKYEGGSYAPDEIDPNKHGNQNPDGKEINYPKEGYNHVENTGGTTAEELNKNNPDI